MQKKIVIAGCLAAAMISGGVFYFARTPLAPAAAAPALSTVRLVKRMICVLLHPLIGIAVCRPFYLGTAQK